MSPRAAGGLLLALLLTPVAAAAQGPRLPNGEPVVGVYYYPWFSGPPYQHVAWTPEFQYDNITNPAHIRAVLRSLTDYGINHAALSYWDNRGSLTNLQRALAANQELFAAGRRLYLSPYLEPPTIAKRFAEAEDIAANVAFVSQVLKACGQDAGFARLGSEPLLNTYVTYEIPTAPDEPFRQWLRARYRAVDRLNAAWGTRLASFEAVTAQAAQTADTAAHADLLAWQAARLREGWDAVRAGVRQQTGLLPRFTGDNSRTHSGRHAYLRAVGGLTWYSFGQAINHPFARPKAVSDVAAANDATFFYTIAPGYVDRQQRWPGARLERDPFLYPYAWVQALSTRPDGIMILTHSEWFEGSVIDVTREFGKDAFETTELYASLFKAGFADLQRRKLARQRVVVIDNDYGPFRRHAGGVGQEDTFGLIAMLEALGVEFDVVAEGDVTDRNLADREVVLVPSCGVGLAPAVNQRLLEWVPGGARTLIVTGAPWWDQALAAGGRAVESARGRGRVVYLPTAAGAEYWSAAQAAAATSTVPAALLDTWRRRLAQPPPPVRTDRPEIKIAGAFTARDTLVVPACHVGPWGQLVREGGVRRDHHAEQTRAWSPQQTEFVVDYPQAYGYEPAEVMAVDSDTGRFQAVPYEREGRQIRFRFPLHFHAVFVLPNTPLRLTWPAAPSITAGGQAALEVDLYNPSGGQWTGVVTVSGGPGLEATPATFSVAPRAHTTVPLDLQAAPDYATGRRTVLVEVSGAGRRAVFWRPLVCRPPALLGTRTTRLGGPAGEAAETSLVLCNVGEAPAEDVTVTIGEATGRLDRLEPGAEAAVPLRLPVPALTPPPAFTPLSLRWQAPDASAGLDVLSGSDGVSQPVTVAGRPGVRPDPTQGGRYLYYRVADERLPPGEPRRLAVSVTFLDRDVQRLQLHFDGGRPGDPTPRHYLDAGAASLLGDGTWRTVVWQLDGATLHHGQNLGADWRLDTDAIVGEVTLRTLPTPPITSQPLTATVSFGSAGSRYERTLSLVRVAVPPATGPGVALRVINPQPVAEVPGLPLSLDLAGTPLAGAAAVRVTDPDGEALPARVVGGRLELTAPLRGALTTLHAVASGAPGPRLRVRDGSAVGWVAVDTGPLRLLWDADRGGALVSLQDTAGGVDHAAHPSGAMGLRWTTADGVEHDLSATPGQVTVSADDYRATVQAMVEADWLRVEDRWLVTAGCSHATLRRTLTARRAMELADLVPVALQASSRRLHRVFPLGVGNEVDGPQTRGELETWAVAPGYLALEGSPRRTGAAAGLVIADPSQVRRVRYGFFGDQMQVRLRGPRALRAGESLTWTVHPFAVHGTSWELPEALHHLLAQPPPVLVGEPVIGGPQRPTPRAPTYLFDVQEPGP